jgi:hypothetical protein
VIDVVTFGKLEAQVKELYQIAFGEKAEGKLGNGQVLQLLNDLEK